MHFASVLSLLLALVLGSLGAPQASDGVKEAVEEFLSEKIDSIVQSVKAQADTHWKQKFDDLKLETEARLDKLEGKDASSRARRDLLGLS